jgi:hypothetical protein
MSDDSEDFCAPQVVVVATVLANIICSGRVARLEGVHADECPHPVLSIGAIAWLSGFTGSSISSAVGQA